MTYAADITNALLNHRNHGRTFETAWALTLDEHPTPEDWAPIVKFLQTHMRAAYYNDPSRRGRSGVAPTDTSEGMTVPPEVVDRDDAPVCRSGDSCPRVATRGRFGLVWCEQHGSELERFAVELGSGTRMGGAIPGAGDAGRRAA